MQEMEKNSQLSWDSMWDEFILFNYKVKTFPKLHENSSFPDDIDYLGKIDSPFAVPVKGVFQEFDIFFLIKTSKFFDMIFSKVMIQNILLETLLTIYRLGIS